MWVERSGVAEAGVVARALEHRGGLVWLDGTAGMGSAGRWSFVGCAPVEVRSARWADVAPLAVLEGIDADVDHSERSHPDAEVELDAPETKRVPRWIGYVAYDVAWSPRGPRGRAPRLPRDPGRPVVWMARYDALYALDHATGAGWIVADDALAAARLARAIADRAATSRDGAQLARDDAATTRDGAQLDADDASRMDVHRRMRVSDVVVDPAEQHERAIAAALEHIACGDVYQVNLARQWRARFDGSPLALAEAMRRASPVPLGVLVDAGDHAVIARTMETFLRWDRASGRLETRPIKGTIARPGDDDARDAGALRADPKERAEHAMIVDLMRNDLSRVAATGTVRVEENMVVEPYAALSHLVSTVAARTRPDVTVREILEATFPPGSVTGTPKSRAIEIIEDLESSARGVYCGAAGYVDRAGGCSFAVAIRCAQIARGEVTYHAGGGIVEASRIDRELAETELKARAFLDAL